MNGQQSNDTKMSRFAQSASRPTGIENEKTREIPLTQGKVTVVDAEDYGWLSQWKWHAHKSGKTFYAIRHIWVRGKRTTIDMQRVILGLVHGDGKYADHVDRDGLNNTRYNLRIVTKQLNNYNRTMQINNISGYRGVWWHKRIKKWTSQIGIDGIQKHLGYFNTAEKAAHAYDNVALKYWGNNAILNFPRIIL